MCGFVVTTRGDDIDSMIDAQRFRGPDARGETIRYFNALTWSHVLLDISGEKEVQPYITSKGNKYKKFDTKAMGLAAIIDTMKNYAETDINKIMNIYAILKLKGLLNLSGL